ncbi:helix-turn-helix domain-containing protein [Neomoorella humiferrea]|uniref:IS66 family insertion sequence element accessory protein TnpA n=1 Tax=Neomoorella humiferrea TaxID=676965 RepID=UPI0030D0AB2C
MTKAERQKLWEDRITAYQKSGQSVKEWCATQEGVSPRQLWYWLRKYKNQNEVSPVITNRWLPVEISQEGSREQALLVKIGPATIEVRPGFDPTLLSQVIKALIALC